MENMKKVQRIKNVPVLSLEDISNAFQPIDPNVIGTEEMGVEYDDFRDYFEREHKEYRIEIDWNQFDEPQIQTLIAILFHSLGYAVDNLHESDRARADGADLIVKTKAESIAIAVKIKPDNKDRLQLSDLSRRKEKKKVYVYIKTPTGKFRESMNDYEETVEFWNENKLNEFFVNRNLGFTSNIVFDSHEISSTIREARRILFGLRNKCLKLRKKETEKLDWQSLMFLWRLKDIAVSLHKPNENVIALLEKPVKIKNRRLNEHFVKIFLEYLDILNSTLKSFVHYFRQFYEKNTNLVHNSIIAEIGRSQWLHLLQYQTDNSLLSLQKELKEAIKNDKLLKELRNKFPDKEEEKYLRERAKNNDVWLVMESRVRNLMIFGCGIEEIIDDIFKEYAQEYLV